MEYTIDMMRNEIVSYVSKRFEQLSDPVKYQFVAQLWNRRAAKLGVVLREIVESEPRLQAWPTKKGGMVLFPAKAFADYGHDLPNVLQAYDLPL